MMCRALLGMECRFDGALAAIKSDAVEPITSLMSHDQSTSLSTTTISGVVAGRSRFRGRGCLRLEWGEEVRLSSHRP